MTRRPHKRPPSVPDESATPAAGKRSSISPAKRRVLFATIIGLFWVGLFGLLEVGLRLGSYGKNTALFLEVEGGGRIDNPEYIARFFPAADRTNPARPSNLFQATKNPSRLRVFVVGESTAQGFPYQRGHSFSRIAAEALAAQEIDIEVINVGNAALSSYYVREVLGDIRRYDPDLIVIYAGHNEYYGTPSLFTGGTHLTRLATLKLRKLRTIQLFEAVIVRLTGRKPVEGASLMEERFAGFLHLQDEVVDQKVAEIFIRNLQSGVSPYLRDGVPVLLFQPVSNLISMPPFRSVSDGFGAPTGAELYRDRLAELESGAEWNRASWEEVRDRDGAPFRARTTLVRAIETYATGNPGVHWIPTADEMEMRAGYGAFSGDYFIDHLHFNFEGQTLLGEILAEAMVETLFPDRTELMSGVISFFEDPERVRDAVHLTDFWEFDAYSTIVALVEEEPFRSMPIPMPNPLTLDRLLANPIYSESLLFDLYRGMAPGEDLLGTTLEYYDLIGNRDEWIRNLNAYIYLFPGDPRSHYAYGIGLLIDDPAANLDRAASYLRQAYLLSNRSESLKEAIRSEFQRIGAAMLWPAFDIQYLK